MIFEKGPNDYLHLGRYAKPDVLVWIRDEVGRRLAKRYGFGGVSFCDVGARGIQVDLKNACEPDKMRLTRDTLDYGEVDGPYEYRGEGSTKEEVVESLVSQFNARMAELEKRGPLCEHDWLGAGGEMCLARYRCSKCGIGSLIDSSD